MEKFCSIFQSTIYRYFEIEIIVYLISDTEKSEYVCAFMFLKISIRYFPFLMVCGYLINVCVCYENKNMNPQVLI